MLQLQHQSATYITGLSHAWTGNILSVTEHAVVSADKGVMHLQIRGVTSSVACSHWLSTSLQVSCA